MLTCNYPECSKVLGANNKSGNCAQHWRFSEAARPTQKRGRDRWKWRNLGVNIQEKREACQGYCEICGKHESEAGIPLGKQLYVDHNHLTGQFRGLLCYSCNLMIGYAKDDITLMKKGIEYLESRGGTV